MQRSVQFIYLQTYLIHNIFKAQLTTILGVQLIKDGHTNTQPSANVRHRKTYRAPFDFIRNLGAGQF